MAPSPCQGIQHRSPRPRSRVCLVCVLVASAGFDGNADGYVAPSVDLASLGMLVTADGWSLPPNPLPADPTARNWVLYMAHALNVHCVCVVRVVIFFFFYLRRSGSSSSRYASICSMFSDVTLRDTVQQLFGSSLAPAAYDYASDSFRSGQS